MSGLTSTSEWRATAFELRRAVSMPNKTVIPARKAPFFNYVETSEDYSDVIYAKIARGMAARTSREDSAEKTDVPQYARYLIVAFASGLLVFLVGVALLVVCLFIKNGVVNLVSSVLLAIGSVTVALALLRGQDIDERSA